MHVRRRQTRLRPKSKVEALVCNKYSSRRSTFILHFNNVDLAARTFLAVCICCWLRAVIVASCFALHDADTIASCFTSQVLNVYFE